VVTNGFIGRCGWHRNNGPSEAVALLAAALTISFFSNFFVPTRWINCAM
jgi:hypothetical protein